MESSFINKTFYLEKKTIFLANMFPSSFREFCTKNYNFFSTQFNVCMSLNAEMELPI